MPSAGATIRMTERAGLGNALPYLLAGEELNAETALRLGFVQEVVAPGSERQRAIEIATLISQQAPLHPQFHRETTGQIVGALKYGGATLKGGAIAGAAICWTFGSFAAPQECSRIEDKIAADALSAIGCLHERGRNVDFAFR
jgi:enoyl-CoA hydratase/carnithine racemase